MPTTRIKPIVDRDRKIRENFCIMPGLGFKSQNPFNTTINKTINAMGRKVAVKSGLSCIWTLSSLVRKSLDIILICLKDI
jgi:hypothetical protein